MAKFCGKCGSPTDSATGLCPICDRDRLNSLSGGTAAATPTSYCPVCGNVINAQNGLCSNPNCSTVKGKASTDSAPAENSESKPKKSKSKSATTITTILLSICLFFTSLFSIIIIDVRNALDEDNVEGLLDNIKATDLLDSAGSASNNDLMRFYNSLKRKLGIEMTDDRLNNFIEKSTVKEFVAEKIADFFEDFYEDEGKLKITYREVSTLLKRNSKVINEEFGVHLYNSELEMIADWIFADKEILIIDSQTLKDETPVIYYGLHIGFSYITMTVFLLLSALIIFFMIKNSASQGSCGIGVNLIVLGAPLTLVAVLAAWLPNLWSNVCGGSFIGILAGNFFAVNGLIGFAVFAVGIAVLVARGLIKRRTINKLKE